MDIKDKVGLITGGAYGIGKKLTETLLQKGAKVSRTMMIYQQRNVHNCTSPNVSPIS